MQKRYIPILAQLALFLLFFAFMALIQFTSSDMPDNDGFYHIKLSYLMRTEGLKPEFYWLPQSILNQNEFYDHHFLFHVALMPFTFGDLRVGAKWAAVTFASIAFLAIWLLFKRQKIPLAWLWAIGLLGISDAFLYRMSITRAQSLSLAVLALACIYLLERKHIHLAVLSFIYVWLYNAFPLIVALSVVHFVAVFLVERRFDYRPMIFVVGGVLAGVLLNPYFPNNITFSIHHILPKLTDATSVRVGNEWFPYETGQLLKNSLPALVAFSCGILALGLSGRRMDIRTAFALLATLLFGLMLFQARRFVEYFPPFALIFTAFAFAPLFPDSQPDLHSNEKIPRWEFSSFLQENFALIFLAIVVATGIVRTIPNARDAIETSKPYDLYAGASEWLKLNTPENSLVFQTDWDDFPRLFFYNTHNTYLIGLDPTYMQIYDPSLYNLWVQVTRGEIKNPSTIILNSFDARYVHSDLKHEEFLAVAGDDPGLKEVYRDKDAIIFEVILP